MKFLHIKNILQEIFNSILPTEPLQRQQRHHHIPLENPNSIKPSIRPRLLYISINMLLKVLNKYKKVVLKGFMFRNFTETSVDVVQKLSSEGANFFDVRTTEEAMKGIPLGSSHIPLHYYNDAGEMVQRAESDFVHDLEKHELDKDVTIIFSCRSGVRSKVACSIATAQGYTVVHNMAGGILAWKEGNYRVKQGSEEGTRFDTD